MNHEQSKAFLTALEDQMKMVKDSIENVKAVVRGKEQIDYSKEQREQLRVVKDNGEILARRLAELEKTTGGNTTTAELENIARMTNENLEARMQDLNKAKRNLDILMQATPFVSLSPEERLEKARDLSFALEIVQLQVDNLKTIAKMAETKFTKYAVSGKAHDEGKLDDLGRALFNDPRQDNNAFLRTLNDFFTVTLPSIADSIKSIFQKAPSFIPKGVDELLTYNSNNLLDLYEKSERYTEKDTVGKWALEAHKKKNPVRDEQITLLAQTITYCNKMKGEGRNLPENEKGILKGCLLALKHQIKKEWNVFDSRLETTVDNLLQTPGLKELSAASSIQSFNNYVSTRSGPDQVDPKMKVKIQKCVEDQDWIADQEPKGIEPGIQRGKPRG